MLKTVFTYLIAIGVFFCFFFFYTAEIFEADVIENGTKYSLDVSLHAFFNTAYLPEVSSVPHVSSVTPTWKGWFLLFICLIGIPLMLAYRIGLASAEKTKK
jgi:hypothetical protein